MLRELVLITKLLQKADIKLQIMHIFLSVKNLNNFLSQFKDTHLLL